MHNHKLANVTRMSNRTANVKAGLCQSVKSDCFLPTSALINSNSTSLITNYKVSTQISIAAFVKLISPKNIFVLL
jgi:hypothetical protein